MLAVIEAFAYALGETELAYSDVPGYQEILIRNGYPDQPSLFGWGHCRKTDDDIFDLGIRSARQTLATSAIAASDIDVLLFCSTCFPGDEISHIGSNIRLLKGLEIERAFPIGLTLNNCTSFLGAIAMAGCMVRSGEYRNVLIVTSDKVYDESIRFNNFALLSDAAASCIVTNRAVAGLQLLGSSFGASESPIDTNRGKDDPDLYRRILDNVLRDAGTELAGVKRVFSSNIFRPITQLKENRLGFSRHQLFLDNVSHYGHCFSADTLINFTDYARTTPVEPGDRFLLAADAPNLRGNLMTEYVTR
jgi:3-oxoacyl-[acyl-carrier-protein] synthase III